MNYIDLENWPRRKHFAYFKEMDMPHFNVCANVNITELHRLAKENNLSLFKLFLYVATRTANELPEFRYRIREDRVVEHEQVHPSFTLMTSEDVFRFCEVKYHADLPTFIEATGKQMEIAKKSVYIEDEPGRDDLLYMTCLPWVSFTSVQHPMNLHPTDSVPRIAWGKFFEEHGRVKMPLSVQAHHALVDGVHVGQYFMRIQEHLDRIKNLHV